MAGCSSITAINVSSGSLRMSAIASHTCCIVFAAYRLSTCLISVSETPGAFTVFPSRCVNRTLRNKQFHFSTSCAGSKSADITSWPIASNKWPSIPACHLVRYSRIRLSPGLSVRHVAPYRACSTANPPFANLLSLQLSSPERQRIHVATYSPPVAQCAALPMTSATGTLARIHAAIDIKKSISFLLFNQQ